MNTQLDTHEYAFVIFTDYCKEGYELEPQLAVIDEEAIRARCATHVEPIQRALKALQDAHDTTDGTIARFQAILYTRDPLFITYGDEESYTFICDNAAHIDDEDILNALQASETPDSRQTPAAAFLNYLNELYGLDSAGFTFKAPVAEPLLAAEQPAASIHISPHGASLIIDASDRWLDL